MRLLRPTTPSTRRGRATALLRRTRGATLVEYSLMLLLILVAGFVAVKELGLNARKATDMAAAKFM
jgi:Flp pilus assembly protein TadG